MSVGKTVLQAGPGKRAETRMDRFAYVGCRTTRERNARGNGIVVYAIDEHSGAWTRIQSVDGLVNPSFLALDRTGRTLYSVHGDRSEISAFRADPGDGTLTHLNQVSTNGRNPVHLAVDPTNRYVVIANHITAGPHVSNLAVVRIEPDGSLGEIADLVPLSGEIGPHRVEQPFAKPHQCVFDPTGRFIAVPDKGLDVIFTFRLDEIGKLHPVDAPPAVAREGAGPRHVVFHPRRPYAFVINELSSTVMACRFDPGTGVLTPSQEVSSLPDTFIDFSRGAAIDISPEGNFLYASNRGNDSVAAYSVDQDTGRLTSIGWVATGGKTPRFISMSPCGDCIFVANEESDNIVQLTRNESSGLVTATRIVAETGSPTCIVFSVTSRIQSPAVVGRHR